MRVRGRQLPGWKRSGGSELNADGGAGIYVLDNTSEGRSFNVTTQLRKNFASGFSTSIGYSFTDARNNLKSTEIASVLWQNEPVKGDPNKPELSYSEFGQRNRIIGSGHVHEGMVTEPQDPGRVFVEFGQGTASEALGQPLFVHLLRRREWRRPGGTTSSTSPGPRARSSSIPAPAGVERTSPRNSSGMP